MNRFTSVLTLALGLLVSSAARAEYLTAQLGSSTAIDFNRGASTFSFVTTTDGAGHTTNFNVGQIHNSFDTILNMDGLITGNFFIDRTTLLPDGSKAKVITTGGHLKIYDDSDPIGHPGATFEADLNFTYIKSDTDSETGSIGAKGVTVLNNFTYNGNNFYLNALFNLHTADMVVSLQLLPDQIHHAPIDVDYLSSLTRDSDVPLFDSSWSATVTAPSVVPVPTTWLMLMTGTTLLGGAVYVRRRFLALA